MSKSVLGHRVDVTSKNSHYRGHWGFAVDRDGERSYFVSGGSIGWDLAPILDRREFKVRNDEVITCGLPDPQAVDEYINDTEPAWGVDPQRQVFRLKIVLVDRLQYAEVRPLDLSKLDQDMIDQTKTKGPITLDDDMSVIDGMHRLADAYYGGERSIQAYVRVP